MSNTGSRDLTPFYILVLVIIIGALAWTSYSQSKQILQLQKDEAVLKREKELIKEERDNVSKQRDLLMHQDGIDASELADIIKEKLEFTDKFHTFPAQTKDSLFLELLNER